MDALVREALKQNELMKRSSVPWKANEPYTQTYFGFDAAKQDWAEQPASAPSSLSTADESKLSKLAVYSWNVDFMLPYDNSRMKAALDALQSITTALPSTTASVVYLQECVGQDLRTIASHAWVRDNYYITDVDKSNWTSGQYGTTTLVDRRLSIAGCFRVHYEKTRMERDILCVDVLASEAQAKPIRLCNTHLESLALEPPFRPPQMQTVARYMHEEGLLGAVAAGDFNAIQDFDRTLHADNDLKDAYLELGGQEDSDEGYTWGQQAATALRNQFGCSRMDKIYYCGNLGLNKFERFGAGVEVENAEERKKLVELGFEKPWITDHLGVVAEFDLSV